MPVPAVVAVDDDQVLLGNPWSYARSFPPTDDLGNPLTYGEWSVESKQTSDLQVSAIADPDIEGNTLLTITGSADVIAAIGVTYFHWYLAETAVFGEKFLTGRVQIVAEQ